MSFQFIPNLIVIISVLGLLVLFLRRLPEVIDSKGQVNALLPALPGDLETLALSQKIILGLKVASKRTLAKVWNFMLEAKDLQQGQILASKFVRMVAPVRKTVNIGVHSSLGKADRLFNLGKITEAEDTYFQIIRKHPNEYAAYEGLVRVYIKQKNLENLIEILEYLIEHVPGNDSYIAQMGNVYMSTRRYQEAIDMYERALHINALVPARFVNNGLSYQSLGNLQKARENLQKAYDLDPTNVPFLMLLVDNLVNLGENDKAIKVLGRAVEMDPDNPLIREKLLEIKK